MNARALLTLSFLLFIYLACNRIFRGRISAEARYLAGLFLMAIFFLPFRYELFTLNMPSFLVENYTQGTVISIGKEAGLDLWAENIVGGMADMAETDGVFSFHFLWLAVYAVGVLISVILTVRRHRLFCKILKRCAKEPSEELLWQTEMLCGKMGLKQKPKLLVCRNSAASLGAPFTFGVFRPVIVMPSGIEGESAEILLEHELHHCKHYDALLRALMMLLKALYWYYLPICFFTKTLETVCEEACDERMTDGKNTAYRAAYGKLLVYFASEKSSFSVSFSTAKEKLKKRIEALFSDSVRKEGYWLILLMLCIATALMSVKFEIQPNFNRQMTGEEYRQSVSSDSIENDLLSAFDAADRLDDLAYGLYYIEPYEYITEYDDEAELEYAVFYRNCLVSLLAVQSEDGTEYQTKIFSADRKRAETCVGIRVIYAEADGEKRYQSIEIMTERELLSSYAEMLVDDFSMTGEWEKSLLDAAKEKCSDQLWFYEILIERAKS